MEDINDYWKMMEFPPVFTNIDWNATNEGTLNQFIPMEFDQPKPTLQHPPFQRRRSSSVDLPINPLYANTNKHIMTEPTIQEEDYFPPNRMNRIGSSATLEFPGYIISDSPHSSTSSCSLNNHQGSSLKQEYHPTKEIKQEKVETEAERNRHQQQQQQQTITFFPELHRTSYNTILGNQLKQHQKRRRSSSLPPAFLKQKQQHVPTPLIFTQIQVTDPTPIQHIQKAAKVDTRPVQIERVHKPTPKPVTCDPVETQKKLDEDLIQLNFEDVTVAELKEMLRERGLTATGKKAVLTERLKDARDLLLKKKQNETTWLKADSVSPNLQGLANMTIHSPIPPNQQLFGPVDDLHNIPPFRTTTATTTTTTNTNTNTNSNTDTIHTSNKNEIDMNELFDFDPNHTNLDGNAIIFPPPNWNQDDLVINPTEWDKDNLDLLFLTLV